VFNTFLLIDCLVNAQLESLYICIKPDYLIILQEFFMSDEALSTMTSNVNLQPSVYHTGRSETPIQRTMIDTKGIFHEREFDC
jgi:hypothetical protein